jgi:hypothetical protein
MPSALFIRGKIFMGRPEPTPLKLHEPQINADTGVNRTSICYFVATTLALRV